MKQNKETEHIEIWAELSSIASKGYSTFVLPDKDKKTKKVYENTYNCIRLSIK